jgi:GIY-YIG catalytic domain
MNAFDILNLQAPAVIASDTKIHLACHNGKEDPLDVYLEGAFDEWQKVQTRKNFKRPYVLSLIAMKQPHAWLFGGLHQSGPPKPYKERYWHYPLDEIPETKHLNGRLVINFERRSRQSYLNAEKWIGNLIVKEIFPEKIQFAKFLGFKSVLLTTQDLRKIVRDQLPDWLAALSSVAGVYLISDTRSGKLYVGSATGEGGLWQRWCSYASTGHGHNVELRAVMKELGGAHVEHFQYSILEIADTHTSPKEILQREFHWKSVLLSRLHGYNKN